MEEKTIDSQTVFSGKIISVQHDTILLNHKKYTREVVRHPGSVAILAINEKNEAILVKQYRYPCKKALLEIPAGKLDIKNESPEQCALRELAEETPYSAEYVELIYSFYTSAGFSDEKLYLYFAKNINKNSVLSCEEDEYIQISYLSVTEAQIALQNGTIEDSKTIIALQYWITECQKAAGGI